MVTLRNLKIKASTCKRIVKELRSYEKEVDKEAAKTADMKEKGADPYDLKQLVRIPPIANLSMPWLVVVSTGNTDLSAPSVSFVTAH
jgi:tubulin-specific chaperone A